MDIQKVGGGGETGLIWLRIGTGSGILWPQQFTFGFHKMQGISWLAEELLASHEELCSMELVLVKTINLKQNSSIIKLF